MKIPFRNSAYVAIILLTSLLTGCAGTGLTKSDTRAAVSGINIISSNPSSIGNANLNWAPPTENADGSTSVTLADYKIYYGTSLYNLDYSANINDPDLSNYFIENLSATTIIDNFTIAAFNNNNMESVYLNFISRNIFI